MQKLRYGASAWATLAALSIFLVPFDLLHLLELKLGMFAGVSGTWLWGALVEPHHAWAALAVCLCLISALHVRVRQLTTYVEAEDTHEILKLNARQRAADTLDRWQTAAEVAELQRARRTG